MLSKVEQQEIKLSGDDAVTRCQIMPVGVNFPADMTFDEWAQAGRFFRSVERAAQWMLGDWINFGETSFGEKFSQELDYADQTITNIASIARRVPIENRIPELAFTYHAEVASLDDFQQTVELQYALEKVQNGGYSVAQFREHLREKYRKPAKKVDPVYGEQEYKNALIYIRDLTNERTPGALPSSEDIAWMVQTIRVIRKATIEAIGEKRK